MRCCALLLAVAAAGLSVGCGLVIDTSRNFINEPIQAVDNLCLQLRCIHWAKAAWKHYDACHAGPKFSSSFHEGFVDGYADYLWHGGTGDPPAYPKRRFTRKDYASYGGYLAIEEWYAGWRAGAAEAIASGRRNLLVVPVNLPVPTDTAGRYQSAFDPAGSPLAGGTGPAAAEPSPLPRPVPAAHPKP